MAQAILRKRGGVVEKITVIDALTKDVNDSVELLELVAAENDEGMLADLDKQGAVLGERVRKAELARMLSGPADHASAIVSVHPGTGGTDAKALIPSVNVI